MTDKKAHAHSRLTIGLPVFNGEAYLREAIESLLSQTYSDFELIISDNASTDRTPNICLDFIKKDHRIRYYRNKKNMGIAWNYNQVFYLSSSQYFKWAAHDDIHHPEYLRKCIEILDSDQSIVLCHCKNARIDSQGLIIGNYDDRTLTHTFSSKVNERFADLISQKNPCWQIFGVIRADILKKTRLNGCYINSDRNLLVELGLIGKMYEIQEHLFFRRDHSDAYTDKWLKASRVRDYRSQTLDWRSDCKKPLLVLPNWKISKEYFKTVYRSHLPTSETILCYKELTNWILRENFPHMKWDLKNEIDYWRLKRAR
jgi:glycosyltransferase involved in cell wall biosynthesis